MIDVGPLSNPAAPPHTYPVGVTGNTPGSELGDLRFESLTGCFGGAVFGDDWRESRTRTASGPGFKSRHLHVLNREQMRAYQRQWRRKRRDAWVKEHGPCVQCGSWVELEVDHKVASEKLLDPSQLWSLSPANPVRIRELDKCQVLCRGCHVKKAREQEEYARGEANGRAKVNETAVLAMRKLRAEGLTYREIAVRYQLSYSYVRRLCIGVTWKHVKLI